MLLLDKQIEASKATTARAQRPGKTEFSYVDKQIIKRELDDMDSQIKSKRKTIEAIRAGDITDPMSPAGELSAQYLADMDPKTVSALRERGILKKNVLAKMDSELKVLEKSHDEMYRTLKGIELGGTVSQAPTEGLTEGAPYGAGPGTQVATPGVAQPGQGQTEGLTQPEAQISDNMKTPENAMKAVLNVQKYNPENLEDAITWFKAMFPDRAYDLENLLNQGAKQPGEAGSPSSQLRGLVAPVGRYLGRERGYGRGLGLTK